MKIRATMVMAMVCAVGSQTLAEQREVPSPNYPTIQSAIDACVDGDEVVIEIEKIGVLRNPVKVMGK